MPDPGQRPKSSIPRGDTVRTDFDWSEVRPTTAIVETVADITGRDVLRMEPLHDVIQTDALDAVFRPTDGTARDNAETSVTVQYLDFAVTVRGDGAVVVRPAETLTS